MWSRPSGSSRRRRRRLRFGTGVALVPQRNPIYTAKEMCTLDWLTDGRIDFGIGVGWNKEEVEACGYRWEDRGARCDEFLEVMRRLWTEPVVDFAGKWVKFETCRLDPKPIQKPHVPIIVGGYADAAFRRAVRFGAGWYGFNRDPAAHQGDARPTRRGIREGRPQARARNSRSSSRRRSRCRWTRCRNTPKSGSIAWW